MKGYNMENIINKTDLEYVFNKYMCAIRNGKPNPRIFKQLITLLEANEICLIAKNILKK